MDSSTPHVWLTLARKLKGVRVQGSPSTNIQYTAVAYPKDNPFVISDLPVSSVGKLVGVKLKAYEMPAAKSEDVVKTDSLTDLLALFIAPYFWEEGKRCPIDIHFARRGRKKLLPQHIEALCETLFAETNKLIDKGASPVRLSKR